MNILFFLKPKSEIAFLYDDFSVRQALEKMEYHRYTTVPIINRRGRYIGTITEGDLLWFIKNKSELNLHSVEDVSLMQVKRRLDYNAISINANMEDLITNAIDQNFVPVVDDDYNFIGIITRKTIMNWMYSKVQTAVHTEE